MTSATDELRRLLDERGVKWMPTAWNPQRETFYRTANGVGICADEYTDGVRIHTDATITPAQAIAATLGRGTCRLTQTSWDDGACTWGCICSACDAHLEHETGIGYNFCPICGAKVVE